MLIFKFQFHKETRREGILFHFLEIIQKNILPFSGSDQAGWQQALFIHEPSPFTNKIVVCVVGGLCFTRNEVFSWEELSPHLHPSLALLFLMFVFLPRFKIRKGQSRRKVHG